MKVYLRDINSKMVDAWNLYFKENADFEVSQGDIFGKTADAIISPANSFGFMDGGIDAVYSRRWMHIQGVLQQHLLDNYYGELPIGNAVIVSTGDKEIPWLISAPTMRVPMDVIGTVNAYLAFRASLIEIVKHNKLNPENQINSILCPGLGTAVGRLPYNICALQMFFAWKTVMQKQASTPECLEEAWNSHYILSEGSILKQLHK